VVKVRRGVRRRLDRGVVSHRLFCKKRKRTLYKLDRFL
jgi:hypothetical protein